MICGLSQKDSNESVEQIFFVCVVDSRDLSREAESVLHQQYLIF